MPSLYPWQKDFSPMSTTDEKPDPIFKDQSFFGSSFPQEVLIFSLLEIGRIEDAGILGLAQMEQKPKKKNALRT